MCKHIGTLLLVAAAAGCLVLLQPFSYAQQPTGRILGAVTDPQGAVVPGVAITVTNVATGIKYKTTTDKDGAYQALNLPIGAYTVTAERQGFRKMVVSTGQLEINQNLKIDVTLQVGAVSEVVEVTTGGVAVEAQSATVGDSITSRPIVDMPLNGRNVFDLARLEPGVTDANQTGDKNYSGQNFSVAGGRVDSVTYVLDGGNNNNLLDNNVVYNPNPDAIAEFRILENSYNAEYGRNAGGVVSVVTKSGTNDWHGTAFEFLRNDALAAYTYFNKSGPELVPKNVLKRHQFGGTFGGPLARDKAFFFFSYQGQRLTQGMTPGVQTVFTDDELKGDFSSSGNASTVASFLQANPYFQSDPTLAAQGTIDPNMIDPAAQKYIAAGIIPHSANGLLNPQSTYKDNFNEYTGKFDFNVTEKDKIGASLGMKRDKQLCPFAQNGCTSIDTTIPFPADWGNNTYFLNLAYTRSFSSTLLNELRFTAQRLNLLMGKPAVTLPNNTGLGVGNTPDQPTGPPEIYFYDEGTWLGFSYRGPTTEVNNTFALTDTVSWVKGKHSMKFGGAFSPFQNNTVYDYYVNGEFDYYGSSGPTTTGSGSDFADFLMGLPDEYYQWPKAPSNIRSKYFAVFAQDEWRIKRNLVLSYGLRYEYSSPMYDTLGRSFSIVPNAHSTRFVNAPVGLLFPGDPGAPRGANFPDTKNFGPRFGFAWDPTGSGKTSIRGGFGMFYDILKGEANLQFNGQAPFFGYADIYFPSPPEGGYTASTGGPNFLGDPFGSADAVNPFPSKPPAPDINFGDAGFLPFGGGGVYFVNPRMKAPYTYQYNLSVQRQIGNSFRADVSYLGSISRKLSDLIDTNPYILDMRDPPQRVLWTQPGADPQGGDWSYTPTFANVGHANYNSFQASLKKQTSEHKYFGSSYFMIGYNWSKNLDNASGFRQSSVSVPYYQPNLFYGLSDIDIAHSITASGGWDLPLADFFPSGPKRLTKGWSMYPIFTWRDGFPIDISASLSHKRTIPGPSGAGDSQLVRVNLVGSSVTTFDPHAQTDPSTGGAIYFSPSNFEWSSLQAMNDGSMPPANQRTYGTLPRDFFRGPGRTNVDFSVVKSTPLWNERTKLEFHADFFNILNSAQFYNPNVGPATSGAIGSPGSPLFGEITRTYPAREIQFALRLSF